MNISVIIPVYNAERFLTKAVESALQFEEVKEVILIEDNSPDNALTVCQELIKKDARIKLFRHPNGENRGAGASRNLGIKKATQKYITFLDADDFYLSNRFEEDKKIFEKHLDADGVYNAIGVHFYSQKAKEMFKKTFPYQEGEIFLTTIKKNVPPSELFGILCNYKKLNLGYFHLGGLTIKKSALDKLKGDWFKEHLKVHQDTEFLFRLSYYTLLYSSNIEKATAVRGVHEENRITSNEKDVFKKMNNRYLQFHSLYEWGKKEQINADILLFIKSKAVYYDILRQRGIKKILTFSKHTVKTKGFLTHDYYLNSRIKMRGFIKNKWKSLKL